MGKTVVWGRKPEDMREIYVFDEEEWIDLDIGKYGTINYLKKLNSFQIKEYTGLVSMDGYIVPFESPYYMNKQLYSLKTPFGRVYLWDANFKPHTDDWSCGKPYTNKKEANFSQKKFAEMYLATGDEVLSYREAYQNYECSDRKAREYAVRLLKQKGVKDYMDKRTKEATQKVGITHEYVLERLKDIADADDSKTAVVALKEFVKILEMDNKTKTNLNITATLPLSKEDMDRLEGRRQALLEEGNYVEYEEVDDAISDE